MRAVETCPANIICCDDHGGVDEVLHDEHGIMKDLNEHGEVVEKTAEIRQEQMQ